MTSPVIADRFSQINGLSLRFLDIAMKFQEENDVSSLEMIAALQEAQNAFIGVLQAVQTDLTATHCAPPPASPAVF